MATERWGARVRGGSPHPTHHAQTGLQSALAAQGIIVLSTISSCWRRSGEGGGLGWGEQLLSGGRGKAGAKRRPPSQASEHMGRLEASHSPKAWIPEESSWLGPAFCEQI